MAQYTIKDSGKRQEFPTGAIRDIQDNKSRPDLISPFILKRLGDHLANGARKYGDRNWEMGMPYSRFIASASRHLMQFNMGDKSEDHLSAVIFNIGSIIHFQELGRDDLNDLPKYEKHTSQ